MSRTIGFSVLGLLLRTGVAVVMPDRHLCCGYPLLSAGDDGAFRGNLENNRKELRSVIARAEARGLRVTHVITACGSCREGIERHDLSTLLPQTEDGESRELIHQDVMQFVLPRLEGRPGLYEGPLLYHASCHPEWVGVHKVKGVVKQAGALSAFTGADVIVSPGCCGESGMGSIASPLVYNPLRKRKMAVLEQELRDYPAQRPILVGCPSCRVGIARSLISLRVRRPVLHTAEWLAIQLFRENWGEKWFRVFRRRIALRADERGIRMVDFD